MAVKNMVVIVKNNRKRLQKISDLLHDVHRFRNVRHDKELKQRIPSALLTRPIT